MIICLCVQSVEGEVSICLCVQSVEGEVIICFIDIGGFFYHHCLNFLFLSTVIYLLFILGKSEFNLKVHVCFILLDCFLFINSK